MEWGVRGLKRPKCRTPKVMLEGLTVLNALPVAVLGGCAPYVGNAVIAWIKARGQTQTSEQKISLQRDGLLLQLLENARAEAAASRMEITSMRPQIAEAIARLAHFDESLDHLSYLLSARGEAEQQAAERRARAFLTRMRSDARDRGEMAVQSSAQHIADDGLNAPIATARMTRDQGKPDHD